LWKKLKGGDKNRDGIIMERQAKIRQGPGKNHKGKLSRAEIKNQARSRQKLERNQTGKAGKIKAGVW